MILALLLSLSDSRIDLPPSRFVDRDAVATYGSHRLRWPAGTRLDVRQQDGELVVRFDRPLAQAAIDALRRAAPLAIGDMRWNDDSLVLRPAAGWLIDWQQDATALSFTFVQGAVDRGDAVASTVAPVDDAADVAFAAIEADAAAGYPGQARRAAQALVARRPDDPRALRTLADARAGDGDVRGADRLYRRVGAVDAPARRARAFAPGAASLGTTVRDGGDLTQVEVAARVDAAVGDSVGVGAAVRHIASRVDTAGGAIDVSSSVVEAGVGVTLNPDLRAQLIAASALDTGVTGGGVRFVAGSAELQLRGGLLLHMPDYSTGPQATGDGYLSRATLGGGYRVTPGLAVQVDVGWNRYGLARTAAESDTITVAGAVDYLVRRGSPSLTIGYRIDAEYVDRNRSSGLVLASRENHSLLGIASGALGQVQLTGQLGYTIDRFGGDGPNAGLGLSAAIGDGWRIDGGGGLTSVSRTGFDGRQLYGRAQITRGLGRGR